MTTPQEQTPQFLAGQILVEISMLQSWLIVLNIITPLTTGVLNTQLTDCTVDLTALLAAPPNPLIVPTKIILPVSLLAEIQYALAIFEYQFNGINRQDYFDMTNNVHSVYDQYSITYFTSGPLKLVIY